MPRKNFLQDLAEAAVPGRFSYIAEISAGECDGSISFTFVAPEARFRLIFQAIVSDSHDYPKDHSFLVFSISEDCPKVVTTFLENEMHDFTGLPINDLLLNIESTIARFTVYRDPVSIHLEQPKTPNSNDDKSAVNDSESISSDNEPGWESEDENDIFTSIHTETELREKIRRDLRAVKSAGLKVGYLGSKYGTIFVSVSCRISKLEISQGSMVAWGVGPSEYLVLLIRYQPTYLDLQTVLDTASDPKNGLVQMYVGLCDSYKPSLEDAFEAFQEAHDRQKSDSAMYGQNFKPLFIGRSLNLLLGERLLGIIKIRIKHGFSWTGAEIFFQTSQCKIYSGSENFHEYYQPDSWATSTPAILMADHMADLGHSTSRISLPLVAMQFTLRHFVKCTEFCLVCHCKTGDSFEALKPYVCSNGLCLYQYMEMGMAPSIEYEIRSQPAVVDLLVSLAYVRFRDYGLEDFPTGLQLRVPGKMFSKDAPGFTPYYIGEMYPYKLELKPDLITQAKVGDWIVIIGTGQPPGQNEWHCRIKHIDTALNHIHISPPICRGDQLQPGHLPAKMMPVKFFVYDTNFDDLALSTKYFMLSCLIDVLPSVDDMKTFIGDYERGKLLSSWEDVISPAGLNLLRWIVASNRSFIIKDDKHSRDLVTGMDDWIQFRFAQGAADKEQRFINAVNSISLAQNPKHPTLFAWHGSPVQNWHSILREGLHFNRISNGRACGNGVYMSNRFHTSLGYTHQHNSFTWPQSRLKLLTVISLNEVVNAPQRFVSCTPHYVVQHLDWIQPRYLFVKLQSVGVSGKANILAGNMNMTKSSSSQSFSYQHDESLFYLQDKSHTALGPDGSPIKIPISILSGERGKNFRRCSEIGPTDFAASSDSCIKSQEHSVDDIEQHEIDDDASVKTTLEDLNILLSDDEMPRSPMQEGAVLDSDPKTDFQPGSMARDLLPILASPQYATSSATKLLQQQLQATAKIQEKVPLHELGWYVDLNLITTVYQWIVELHTFDPDLPLAKDLKAADMKSVVLELRFPPQFPMDPPFVRVIRPRFLEFAAGGGGHVTTGGSMCMELLTHSGWLPTASIESVLLQVRMAIISTDPRPARLNLNSAKMHYSVAEAVEAYRRVSMAHGWEISKDIQELAW